MEQAVIKKLAYLQSDDIFADDDVLETQDDDDSLLAAFNESIATKPVSAPLYKQPSAKEFYQTTQNTAQPKYTAQPPTPQSIEEHKQNIAARIAALRGISTPGDYLRKK